MTEELEKKLNYNCNGGECCGTCKNNSEKSFPYGDHFSEHGSNRLPYCYKIESIIGQMGHCDAYESKL